MLLEDFSTKTDIKVHFFNYKTNILLVKKTYVKA